MTANMGFSGGGDFHLKENLMRLNSDIPRFESGGKAKFSLAGAIRAESPEIDTKWLKNKAFVEGRRELKEDEYQTACTQACPAGAITFGDLNNPKHAVYKLKKNPNAFRLLEKLETNPKVYYVSSKKWVRQQGDNHLISSSSS